MKIDVHHHMFPPALLAAMEASRVTRVGGELVTTTWTPDQSLDFMDRHAIESAILSVPTPLPLSDHAARVGLARRINDYGRETVEGRHGRFGFFATLPLPDVPAAIAEARRALDELEANGIALLTNQDGVYQGDPHLDPLYAELNERDAVCFVHPTVPSHGGRPLDSPLPAVQASVLEFPFDTTRAITNLIVFGVLSRFPRISFLFTHAGGCVSSLAGRMIDRRPLVAASVAAGGDLPVARLEAMLAEAQRAAALELARLHFDVALSSDEQALSALTRIVPASQLLLGTDFPIAQEIGGRVSLNGVTRFSGFTARERAAVERLNAARLLPTLGKAGESAGASAGRASLASEHHVPDA